jgi:hypothetical protein
MPKRCIPPVKGALDDVPHGATLESAYDAALAEFSEQEFKRVQAIRLHSYNSGVVVNIHVGQMIATGQRTFPIEVKVMYEKPRSSYQ